MENEKTKVKSIGFIFLSHFFSLTLFSLTEEGLELYGGWG